jgi:hypothetical protein
MVSDIVRRGLFHRHISSAAEGRDAGQNVATVALMDFELHIGSVRTGAERRCSRVHRQTKCDTSVPLRSTAERLEEQAPRSRALCEREQRGARSIDTVCPVAVVPPPGRGPYAADCRRSCRVDRGCSHSQNAGARWREREHTGLDERSMARRTTGVALTVGVPDDVPSRTRSRPGGARWRSCSIVGWHYHHGRWCSSRLLSLHRRPPRLF